MSGKARHWTFIVYPDSVIPTWIDFLIETGLPFAISPLHCNDLNPDGTTKKPHYHVVITYDGPTTYNAVKSGITDIIMSPIPKRVMSLRGMYRYLCHLDNPEKYQYSIDDIKEYNNFHIDMTESEITLEKARIINEVDTINVKSYYDLIMHYLCQGDYDSFKICSNNVYFFSKYIDSRNRI